MAEDQGWSSLGGWELAIPCWLGMEEGLILKPSSKVLVAASSSLVRRVCPECGRGSGGSAAVRHLTSTLGEGQKLPWWPASSQMAWAPAW